MASLVIEKAKGIDRRSSDIDIDPSYATQLKNFSLTKRPQAWSKTGTYADAATSLFGEALPANITWLNIAEMGLTQPSNTDIYVLHGKDASNNHHLWVSHYWDGSAFQSGFRKLTESAGQFTAGSGTNANQVVVNSTDASWASLSATNDYYNGQILTIDIDGASLKTAAIVQDYQVTATTKTFLLNTGSFGSGGLVAAADDTFYVSRSPLFGDAASGTIGGITQVDDIIRFAILENSLWGMTGNTYEFPSQYQIWYGYVNRHYGTTDGTGSDEQYSDFWLDLQQPLAPYVDSSPATNRKGILSASAVAGGNLTVGDWQIYCAYIYDGISIGPLSSPYTVTTSGGNQRISLSIRIGYENCYDTGDNTFVAAYDPDNQGDTVPTNFSPHLVSRRVTGLRIYAKIPGESEPKFVDDVNSSGTALTTADIIVSATKDSETVNNVLQMTVNGLLNGSLSFDNDPTGNTYVQDVGQTNIRPNFKYGVSLDSHFIAAGIRVEDGEIKNNYLISSIVDGFGVATFNNFGASNIINLGFFGSKQITGIKVIGDTATTVSPKRRLAVFTDDDYYILTLTTGASFDFALDKVGEREGCVAPDSLVAAEGLIFGISRNGFRVYTETGTRIIGEGLKTDFDSLTDPSECVGEYYKKERYVLFAFPTDQKYYAVNLLSENLDMFELSFAHVMTILLGTRAGELYSMSTSAIYLHGSGNTQAGTAITPQWKSKRLTAKDFFDEKTGFRGTVEGDFLPNEGFIRYRSDSAITLNAYRNGGTAITFPNLSLPAQTTMQSKRFKFPLGLHCDDIDLEVTLSASQASSNTYLEFDLIKIVSDIKRRID